MSRDQNHGALSVRGLTVDFGAVRAVNDVSFDIAPGSIVGLIGPNGAGKTTILDGICSLVTASGEVWIGGVDVTDQGASQRSRRGLGRSFQDARLFTGLTVRETIAIGLQRHLPPLGYLPIALGLGRRQERDVREAVDELVDLMGLGDYADKFVSELSTGTRRIVDLATVVAHEPQVLLLDEPSSGIAQREAEALGPVILQIRDRLDCTVLIVEHDMPLITGITDELLAFTTGTLLARGEPTAVVNDPLVVESYLGTNASVIQRSGAAAN